MNETSVASCKANKNDLFSEIKEISEPQSCLQQLFADFTIFGQIPELIPKISLTNCFLQVFLIE